MVKRIVLVSVVALIAAQAGSRFDTRLSSDQQISHVLSRLTFGPRPGDVEQVRRLGIERWTDLQLHPERIPENPVLDTKLKPLETLRMDPVQVVKDYSLAPLQMQMITRPATLNTLLSQEEMRKALNGTAEERRAVLIALDPEKRKQVLMLLPPTNLESIPEFQKQAEDARKERQDENQKEARLRNPPLIDLLSQDQINTATRGNPEQLQALFSYLDPEKRRLVAGALPPQSLAEFPEMRRDGMRLRQPQQVVTGDLKEGKLFRALYSNRQLEEVLVDFWFNHFNVYEGKNVQLINNSYRTLLVSYERDAIRPWVLGHFKDLLLATARHPAMLYYLDNWGSMSPDTQEKIQVGPFASGINQFAAIPPGVARQAHGLNENYGRELMELHTLGVDGGYTQQDVIEVARCFTGWTVRKPNDPEFAFVDFMHDDGEKVVLGHKIAAGGGEKDGLQVIDILAHHPSTAHFISKQLAQRFVADDPPPSLVDRMAQTFLKTDGDLRAVLQTMFASTEFLSEGAWQAKIKSPFEMVVSAVRASGADATDTWTLVQKVSDLGQPLYNKVEPNGYPLVGDGWLGTADLLGRMNFATALVSGQIPGVKLDASRWEKEDAPALARELLGRDASPQALEAISNGLKGKEPTPRALAGLIMSSPDFQRR
jgi:uncharacterized protein (DUF1800 family)